MRRLDQPRLIVLGGDLINRFSTGSGGAASLSITAVRPEVEARFAPEAVEFTVEASGFGLETPVGAVVFDPNFQTVEYEWDFGEPGLTYDAPSDKLPPDYADANSATGPRTAHVFTTPGTFTVTCRAYVVTEVSPLRKVLMATATTDITIGDPAWDATNTVVLALDGDFTGAPAGAQRSTIGANSFDGAYGAIRSLQDAGATRVRLLLKRGESLPSLTAANLHQNNFFNLGAVYVDEWGDPAADPFTLRQITDSTNQSTFRPLIFSNIRLQGNWDSTTQTGGDDSLTMMRNIQGGYWLFHRMAFENASTGANMSSGWERNGTYYAPRAFLHECTSTDLAGYSLYAYHNTAPADELAAFYVMGCRFAHNPHAEHGTQTQGVGNSQGPIRHGGNGHIVIQNCYLFSIQGWSPGGSWSDGEARSFFQHCIRVSPEGFTRIPNGWDLPEVVISRNVLDGNGSVSCRRGSAVEAPPLGKMVVEQNIMMGPVWPPVLETHNACFTHRNNVQVHSGLGEVITDWFVRLDIATGSSANVTAEQVQEETSLVYNNTWVALSAAPPGSVQGIRTEAEGSVTHDPTLFPNVVSANNILHAPSWPANTIPEQVDLGSVDATPIVETSYLGRKEQVDGGTINMAFSVPAGIFSLYAPDTPVAAADLPAAARDVFGDDRLTATSGGV